MLEDLTQDELNELAHLLTISGKAKEREALCIKIGISYYKELDFIYGSSDSSFAINLINHLKNVGNTEAICQLCCKELSHIFKGNNEYFLNKIAVKLNCNYHFGQNSPKKKQQTVPSFSSAPSVSVNPSNQLVKSIIAGGTILLIGLAGFGLYNQNKNSSSPSTQTTPPTPITPSTLDPEYPITSPIETQQPKASTAPIILLYGYKTDPSLFNKIQNSVGYPIKDSGIIYNSRPDWLATKPTVIYSDDNFKNFASQLAKNLTNSTGIPFVTQYVYRENRVEHQFVRWDISIHIAGI